MLGRFGKMECLLATMDAFLPNWNPNVIIAHSHLIAGYLERKNFGIDLIVSWKADSAQN